MVEVRKVEFKGWENCFLISNNRLEAIVTTDVGPRIIYFGFKGGKNVFCVVEEQAGKKGSDEWRIYGGTRLWHSPEAMPRSYYPDNTPVEYEILPDGIVLIQPTEEWTKLQKIIEFKLDSNLPKAYVTYIIKNNGLFDVKVAAWALSVMRPGGVEVMPIPKIDTGLLPSYPLVMWPYTKLNDHRVIWGESFIILRQDPNCKPAFKIGYPNIDGWACYLNESDLFIKYYRHTEGAEYPDFGSSYETYTTDFMLEMETLSPLYNLAPGSEIIHNEEWELHRVSGKISSEDDVKRLILPIVKKDRN
ncbi:hypothetical protein [Caldicellulosiruptor morganii]|uniref:DUF4380 domain-containing protein n=1 Tax=Caldicellulosiruptor morganii TaxID=1387555 RepID=A0ABY7BS93_9FIRM|nr:hypothetical protein [Caldicellulosiruptor morganii]WAM34551.1 hypothetical protein OTK00_000765 [Caldicellulosiruptor morganii]